MWPTRARCHTHRPACTACTAHCTAGCTAPCAPQYFKSFPNAAVANASIYPDSEFGGCGINNVGQYTLDFTSYGAVKPAVW